MVKRSKAYKECIKKRHDKKFKTRNQKAGRVAFCNVFDILNCLHADGTPRWIGLSKGRTGVSYECFRKMRAIDRYAEYR